MRATLHRAASVVLLAVVLAVATASMAAAQQPPPSQGFRNPISDLLRLFSPPQRPQPPPPAPAPPRKKPPAPMVLTDQPSVPKADPTVFVAVIGDSLAENLAGGLTEAFENNPDVQVQRRGRSSTGLVRDDFYDWRKATRELLASDAKVTHLVVMMGSNDRQTLRDATGATLEPFTDAWREAYAARVDELAAIAAERNVPLIWVGMPPMQNARTSADMLALNEIVRARLVRGGRGAYVDIWEAFTDPQNRFSATGPALTGETARLRANDGIHLTKAGARKAAHFVEIELKRMLNRADPTPVFAMPSDPNDPASSDPALQPGGIERVIDDAVRRGLEGLPPLPVNIPTKAIAGPILPLNAPEATTGGALLAGAVQRGSTDAGRLIEQVLVEGRSPDSKPGRADDFRWPGARAP
ncbi:SGNH/GDSL hydrolase family protein [Alsobacter sp. R-9]